jgi:membrane protease subunit HflK
VQFDMHKLRLIPVFLLALVLIVWFVWGGPAYTVDAAEEGVVLTFGRYSTTSGPGLHFKWPWPIQMVEKVKTGESKRLEVGFRSEGAERRGPTGRSFVEAEARMLTGDENVVDAAMVVQYRIIEPIKFLFNFEPVGEASVEGTLEDIGEAALRQAVGDHPIDDVMTVGKTEIQNEIMETMQKIADEYRMGISVSSVQLQDVQPPQEVADAFLDVATAREEREEKINTAKAYASDKLPKAQGEAARTLQVAEGYKQARIAEAQGSVARFVAISKQYDVAPELMRMRLYLETMDKVLPKVNLKVIDPSTGVVNLNDLGAIQPKPAPKPTSNAAPTEGGR